MSRKMVFEAGDYGAQRLEDDDLSALQALLERCADYFAVVERQAPSPNAATDLFIDVAPGKTLDDKVLLGLWDRDGELIGVMDLMRDYPETGTWFVGLLLIDPGRRGQGIGAQLIEALIEWAKTCGVRALGLGVVEHNSGALRFWQRMGFETVRVTEPRPFGTTVQTVTVMKKDL